MADILINCNTAFFKFGNIEVGRVSIVKNYLRYVGVCDILVTYALIYDFITNAHNNDSNLVNLQK